MTAESRGAIREVRATHDEEYLYLRLQLDKPYGATPLTLGFDVRPGANGGMPGLARAMPGADVRSASTATVTPRCARRRGRTRTSTSMA